MKRKLKILLVSLVSIFFITACGNKEKTNESNKNESTENNNPTEQTVKTVDVNSNERPYGIMINNHHAAWPQSGLKNAYMVYEIITEGGITRMLALFQNSADAEKIGSIRSARPIFLDYAMENDAIFIHWGGSDRAYSDIASLKIEDMDGMRDSGFWKDGTLNRATEHTAFTSIQNIKNVVTSKGYRTTTDKGLLLKYSAASIDLSKYKDVKDAKNVSIKYSNYQTSSYTYDEANKVYLRSMSNTPHVDLVTNEQYTVKNIIVYAVNNYLDSTHYYQDFANIGSGQGYYITEGKAVPITWEKSSRSSKTIYKFNNGEELKVNDGNTFIQIYPTSGNLTIN